MNKAKPLRESVDRGIGEVDAFAVAANRDEPQVTLLGGSNDGSRVFVIDVDDRTAARFEQFLEQPKLGGEIRFDRWMIIEMITRQIGEGSRGDAEPIEPILIEAVRGGFDRKPASASSERCSATGSGVVSEP
jgi:hypothetical protein